MALMKSSWRQARNWLLRPGRENFVFPLHRNGWCWPCRARARAWTMVFYIYAVPDAAIRFVLTTHSLHQALLERIWPRRRLRRSWQLFASRCKRQALAHGFPKLFPGCEGMHGTHQRSHAAANAAHHSIPRPCGQQWPQRLRTRACARPKRHAAKRIAR